MEQLSEEKNLDFSEMVSIDIIHDSNVKNLIQCRLFAHDVSKYLIK